MSGSNSQDFRRKVIEHVKKGNSCHSASMKFEIASNTVRNWYKRYKLEVNFLPRKVGGKKGRLSKEELSVFMPMRLKKRCGRKMVLVPEGKAQLAAQNASIDTTLVKALVRAHLWQRQLQSGKYQTMQDLCDANKVTAKYVQLILRLNFLAPKLKEAILLGYQPRHMKLADLMQNIPSLWHEQGELFGCEVV